jgi:multiple sugar transport system permease protein
MRHTTMDLDTTIDRAPTPERANGLRRWLARSGRLGIWFVAPAILVLLLVVTYPILYQAYLSLFRSAFFVDHSEFVGLRNYVDTFSNAQFWHAMWRMAIWTAACVSLQFVLGFAAALVFNERFFGRGLLRALLLVPWIVPVVVAASTWRWMYHPDFGVINALMRQLGFIEQNVNWLGNPDLALWSVVLVNVWKMFPFVMLMLLAGLQAIPRQLYEAAWVDGANILHTFRFVTLPAMRAVSVVTLLLLIIWTLNSFTIIFVMTEGGPLRSTEVMSLYIYRLAFRNFQFEEAAAVAMILFVVMLVFSVFYIRRLYVKEQD